MLIVLPKLDGVKSLSATDGALSPVVAELVCDVIPVDFVCGVVISVPVVVGVAPPFPFVALPNFSNIFRPLNQPSAPATIIPPALSIDELIELNLSSIVCAFLEAISLDICASLF